MSRPDGFVTASIKNMQYSDYRSNRAANLRVIRGKHLKTDGETQRRGTLTDRLRKVGLAPMPAQCCATCGLKRLLLNRSERRNGRDFIRFQLFRLLGLAIAVLVTSSHVFSRDGPVPINPTPTVDDNSAASANKQRWRLPGIGRD